MEDCKLSELSVQELSKYRIELLKDALKDVQETIRAQDRKASYIIAIEFFMISSFIYAFFAMKSYDKIDSLYKLVELYPIVFFIISILYLFYSYSPVTNPQEVLDDKDKDLGKNKFFVFYSKDLEYSSHELSQNLLNDIDSEKNLLRVVYIEILKLSKIRERKIKYINIANDWLLISFVFMILQIILFFDFTLYTFLIGSLFALLFKGCK